MITPILMLGAGRMGGAMVDGWLSAGAFAGADLIIRDPQPGRRARRGARAARREPPDAELARAHTVVLAVKPQMWREAARGRRLAARRRGDRLHRRRREVARHRQGVRRRCVARVMPTTAAAIGQGTASLYADDPAALARAHALFEPLGAVWT
jgi:pyrroline-5-carboxylate reductase